MPAHIRPARPDDGPRLQDIERRAGLAFRDVGMPEIADDDPPPLDVLERYAEVGRSWVAVDERAGPVGYVLADVVDRCAHVEQISVDPDHQGGGLGRALLDAVRDWAAGQGLAAITLATFRDVAWNAPLYRHLGFRDLDEDEIGPELRAVRATETAHGLDPARRVCMRAELSGR